MNLRRTLLFATLAASLAAAWWVSEPRRGEGPERVEPSARMARPDRMAAGQPVAERGGGPRIPEPGRNLFPPQSWQPPPPPPASPTHQTSEPPRPPAAPPLPFTYVGRWREEGREALFLNRGEQLFIVHPGEVVAQWRVDAVTEDSVTFIYLPLEQRQIMRLMP